MGLEAREVWADSESVEEETPQQWPWDREFSMPSFWN